LPILPAPPGSTGADTNPRKIFRKVKTALARSDMGNWVLKMAPPTFKCGSSASRAMNKRMISLEPSKMVFTRQSRRNRSTEVAGSPRPASECAVS